MKVSRTATAGRHGVSLGRCTSTIDATMVDQGYEQYELPAPNEEGSVLLADVTAMLFEKGYTVTGAWLQSELDGDVYFQAPIEKIWGE